MSSTVEHPSAAPGPAPAPLAGAARAPLERSAGRERRARILAGLALAALVVGWAAVITWHGLRVHTLVLYDEVYSVIGARLIEERFPEHLVATGEYLPRGLERLTQIVLLGLNQLAPTTAGELRLGHAAMGLVFSLAALPTYLLARGLRVARGWALAAAAMAIAVPWAVYGLTFLNTSLGYATLALFLYATWRTAVRPSPAADALALGAIGLMATARVGHAPLAVVLPLTVLWVAWHDRASEPPLVLARRLPGRLWREHPLLVVAGALAVLAVAVVGPQRLAGSYDIADVPVGEVWDRLPLVASHLGPGTAWVALVVALAWLGRTLVRPRDRDVSAFAVLATIAAVVHLYVVRVGPGEERYYFVLAPLVFVAFVAALARDEVAWAPTLLVGMLVAGVTRPIVVLEGAGGFTHFNSPADTYFTRVWLGQLSLRLPDGWPVVLVLAGAVAVAVALGLLRPALRRPLAVLAAAGTIVSGAVGGVYEMRGLNAGVTAPERTFAEQTFADRFTGGASAGVLAYGPADDHVTRLLWLETQFFNRSVDRSVTFGDQAVLGCCGGFAQPVHVQVDPRTGAHAVGAGEEVPPYLLTHARPVPAGFASEVVHVEDAARPLPDVRLERLARPYRIAWAVRGVEPLGGWARPGRPAVVRVFPPAAEGCVRFTLTAPPETGAPIAYSAGPRRGSLADGATARVEVPVAPRGAPVDVPVRTEGSASLDGTPVTLQVSDVRVAPCGTPDPAPSGA